jgi:hypothetical protein
MAKFQQRFLNQLSMKAGPIIHGHVQFFMQGTESFKLGQNISADF